MNLKYYICILLIFHSQSLIADFRTIAKTGMQAADFANGFYYASFLGDPVIGNGGHVTFSGRVLNNEGDSINAIWTGKPGALINIIKKGDIVNEFESAPIFVSSLKMNVSKSGDIGFEAGMVDSKDSLLFSPLEKSDGSYLALVDGSVKGVIQENASAPGFIDGVTVQILDRFLFSDQGMAIHGKTSSLQETIWFWNHNTTDLIVTRGAENTTFYPGCFVIRPYLVDLNEKGEVLIYTEFQPNNDLDCPSAGLFTWKAGVYRTVITNNSTLLPDALGGIQLNGTDNIFDSSINNAGDVSFAGSFNVQNSPQIKRGGSFVIDTNSEIEYTMLGEEEISIEPVGPHRFILPNKISASNSSGKVVGMAHWDGGQVILTGGRNTVNRSTVTELGESHLSVLVHKGVQAEGLGTEWSFSQQKYGRPQINEQGRIIFSDTVNNYGNNGFGKETWGVWGTYLNNQLNLIIADGVPIVLDGKKQALDHINQLVSDDVLVSQRTAVSTNSGFPSSFNDLNQLLILGRYTGTLDHVIALWEENDCVAKYHFDGTVEIPCVEVLGTTAQASVIYKANLKQSALSPVTLTFELTSAELIEDKASFNGCMATFSNNVLTLPCVRVPIAESADSLMYEANLSFVPLSGLLTFELIGAQLHN